jgi:hypothetical protein
LPLALVDWEPLAIYLWRGFIGRWSLASVSWGRYAVI